jgi:AcrR family transcriptional regulator
VDTSHPGPQGPAAAERPLRSHARRNRDALLVAARQAFEAGEANIRMEELARRAGVGVGTLYRHFATREALVEAVYRRRVADLCATAPRLLAEGTPYDALDRFLRQLVTQSAASAGMAGALETLMNSGSPVFAESRTAMIDAIASILSAGAKAGDIRADVPARTVFHAMGGVCASHDRPGWESDAHEVVRLLLDGLRPPFSGHETPPGRASAQDTA